MDKLIDEGVKVDAIICDPPYQTTECEWDKLIPFDEMWKRIDKLIKVNGAVALFGIEPFSSKLRLSNKKYRYDWYWEKTLCSNFLNLKRQPAKKIENICIFYKKQPTYNPQMLEGKPYTDKGNRKIKSKQSIKGINNSKTSEHKEPIVNSGTRYPKNRITFANPNNKNVHPTQKPVDLLEYIVRTYTNEGELVLDFTMGSGSTGVACMNTDRRFIGIELDVNYFNIAKERIENAINGK